MPRINGLICPICNTKLRLGDLPGKPPLTPHQAGAWCYRLGKPVLQSKKLIKNGQPPQRLAVFYQE